MSHSRLEMLGVIGIEEAVRVLGTVDLYHLGRVHALTQTWDFGDVETGARSNLRLVAAYGAGEVSDIELVFRDACEIRYPTVPQLEELHVHDVAARQLSGIQYEVIDHGASGFRCYCRAIEFRVIEKVVRSV